DLASVVDDVAARWHGHRAGRVEGLAGAHPPGAGEHHEESIVRVEVRTAHVAGQPPDAHDVRARLARVAVEHRLLVGAGGVSNPFDIGGRGEIRRAAVEVAGVARRQGYEHEQRG